MHIMSHRLKTVRKLTFIISFAAATGAAAEFHFGPTALASTETARLNAYCDGSVVPGPCKVTFEFRDADGSVLIADTQILRPGTAGFLDLSGPRAGIRRGHGELDPCVDIELGGALTSLEIFETASLLTRGLINLADRSMPRTGDIDFAPAGVGPGETARLGAFCPADQRLAAPCDVTFEFHDASGAVLKQSRAQIRPGAAAFLDFTAAEGGGRRSRVTIEPCMKTGDQAVVATLAIIDDGMQRPTVQAYPAALVQ